MKIGAGRATFIGNTYPIWGALLAAWMLREKLQQQALQEIERTEKNRAELLKKPSSMLIGNLAVGKDFPMRVLAEIVDAALMDKEIYSGDEQEIYRLLDSSSSGLRPDEATRRLSEH